MSSIKHLARKIDAMLAQKEQQQQSQSEQQRVVVFYPCLDGEEPLVNDLKTEQVLLSGWAVCPEE